MKEVPRRTTKLPDDVAVPAWRVLILSLDSLSTGKQCLYTACVAMWYNFFIDHGSALQDHQICEPFSFCREEEIWRQFSGSMRVTVIDGNGQSVERGLTDVKTGDKQAEWAEKYILPDQRHNGHETQWVALL